MGGSTADTPTTPEFLRVSDADRDHAVNELRSEFVDGRLSHETFVYRMQTALDARNRGQLAGLFTDLPPRRSRLLDRLKAALHGDFTGADRPRADPRGNAGRQPIQMSRQVPRAAVDAAWAAQDLSGHRGPAVPFAGAGRAGAQPLPLFFPPGRSDRYTIGRTRECDLCLTDLSVSRLHAELLRDENGWMLNDLGSHNGTRLNGWLVRETVQVRAGDRLEFGSTAFVLADNPHEAAAAQ
jgi:Inner membrane component of T3SS, cytoplasmic domain/Domain of unknown function (DUF1707)